MTIPGAPMEARAREVLARLAVASGEFASIHFEGPWNPWAIAVQAMIEFATAPTPAAEEVERVARALNALDERGHGLEPWDELTDEARAYRMQQAEIALAPSTQLQPGGAGFNETADPLKVAEEMRERCAVFLERHADAIMAHVGGVVGALVGPQVAQLLRTDATAIRALPLTGAGDGGEEG